MNELLVLPPVALTRIVTQRILIRNIRVIEVLQRSNVGSVLRKTGFHKVENSSEYTRKNSDTSEHTRIIQPNPEYLGLYREVVSTKWMIIAPIAMIAKREI